MSRKELSDEELERRKRWKSVMRLIEELLPERPTDEELSQRATKHLPKNTRGKITPDLIAHFRSMASQSKMRVPQREQAKALLQAYEELGVFKDPASEDKALKASFLAPRETSDFMPGLADVIQSLKARANHPPLQHYENRFETQVSELVGHMGANDAMFFISMDYFPLGVQNEAHRKEILRAAENKAEFCLFRPGSSATEQLEKMGLVLSDPVQQFHVFLDSLPSPAIRSRFELIGTELVPFMSPGHRYAVFCCDDLLNTTGAFGLFPAGGGRHLPLNDVITTQLIYVMRNCLKQKLTDLRASESNSTQLQNRIESWMKRLEKRGHQ